MGSPEKDIELSPVKTETKPHTSKSATERLTTPAHDDEDVIIGRFRKISSAKSMAATNGNIQYPTDIPVRNEDMESGLQIRKDLGEKDKLISDVMKGESGLLQPSKSQTTKSSFRDVEKPSRFRDQPSATRFQVSF